MKIEVNENLFYHEHVRRQAHKAAKQKSEKGTKHIEKR